MNLFEKYFRRTLKEDMTAGAGGVLGDGPSFGHGGDLENSDFYATGDYRLPKSIYGGYLTRKGLSKKKKKKKKDNEISP